MKTSICIITPNKYIPAAEGTDRREPTTSREEITSRQSTTGSSIFINKIDRQVIRERPDFRLKPKRGAKTANFWIFFRRCSDNDIFIV